MQPTQLSSWAVYIGNQPSLLAVLRHANTSTGHTARQKPHALHMSSPTMTSHRPAGPREAFFSVLNSGMSEMFFSIHHLASYKHAIPNEVNRNRSAMARRLAGDFGVDAGRNHAIDRERLGDVLEAPLAQRL